MSHHTPIIPALADELSAQYFQMIQGFEMGLYLEQTGSTIPVIDQGTDIVESEEKRSNLRYFDPRTCAYTTNQIYELDAQQNRSDEALSSIRAAYIFSPLTLLLCQQNQDFKNVFMTAFEEAQRAGREDQQANERMAFITAFSHPSMPVFSTDDEFIQNIRAYANKKSAQVKHEGQLIDSPKKALLNALANALTTPTQTREINAAGALFDAGTHPRILKNTGFWAMIRKIFLIDFFSKEKHQTKSFSFCGAFFNAPRSVHNPLAQPAALAGQGVG